MVPAAAAAAAKASPPYGDGRHGTAAGVATATVGAVGTLGLASNSSRPAGISTEAAAISGVDQLIGAVVAGNMVDNEDVSASQCVPSGPGSTTVGEFMQKVQQAMLEAAQQHLQQQQERAEDSPDVDNMTVDEKENKQLIGQDGAAVAGHRASCSLVNDGKMCGANVMHAGGMDRGRVCPVAKRQRN